MVWVALVDELVARGHMLFGLFFLVIVADETRRRFSRNTSAAQRIFVPATLLAAGVAMWIATIRANSVAEYIVHSLWADVLLIMGTVEWARRKRALVARGWALAQPAGIVASGVLLFVHLHGSVSSSPGARSHLLMGTALVFAGFAEAAVRLVTPPRRWNLAAQLPILGFVALLITYPQ